MKTLSEIIDAVKDGEKPEYDDLRYAVVAMCALHHFALNGLAKLEKREREGKYRKDFFGLAHEVKERVTQFQAALKMPPKNYCGPQHDPDTEECQKFRTFAKKLVAKCEAKIEAEKKP